MMADLLGMSALISREVATSSHAKRRKRKAGCGPDPVDTPALIPPDERSRSPPHQVMRSYWYIDGMNMLCRNRSSPFPPHIRLLSEGMGSLARARRVTHLANRCAPLGIPLYASHDLF
ncbi:hypothetical protein J6590_014543 [Homalodisca vitripennis]|nr:hypothetical protein J6590_074917 [Homalodisca vitripennis]KAG8264257.1 hypothetical protein J6590_014543 [Homalodisca vitripennis]